MRLERCSYLFFSLVFIVSKSHFWSHFLSYIKINKQRIIIKWKNLFCFLSGVKNALFNLFLLSFLIIFYFYILNISWKISFVFYDFYHKFSVFTEKWMLQNIERRRPSQSFSWIFLHKFLNNIDCRIWNTINLKIYFFPKNLFQIFRCYSFKRVGIS